MHLSNYCQDREVWGVIFAGWTQRVNADPEKNKRMECFSDPPQRRKNVNNGIIKKTKKNMCFTFENCRGHVIFRLILSLLFKLEQKNIY